MQAEWIKAAQLEVKEALVACYNVMFSTNNKLNIGEGKLILIKKPGKPTGPVASLTHRPIACRQKNS